MEPERKIEKVLRAYAKKRRDEAGAPPELHPATRRLLQDEIARRRPKPDGEGFFASLFASAGRKLAFAVCVMAFLLISGMLIIPSLSGAKRGAQASIAVNNLHQVDAALQQFALENGGRMPAKLDELGPYLGRGGRGDQLLVDPQSGQRFIYVGGGNRFEADPQAMLAYSPVDDRGRFVLFADGHVDKVPSSQFAELSNRTVALIASASSLNRIRSADTLASSAPAVMQPPLAQDKEKTDGSKLVAGTAGAAQLEDRQRELVAAEKSQSRENIMPASVPKTEVGAESAARKSTATVADAFINGASGEARQSLVAGYVSATNTEGFVANNKVPAVVAGTENQVPAEVAKSESRVSFAVAANEPASAPASVEELKAGSKLFLKRADANDNDGATAYAVSQQYAQTVAPGDVGLRDKKISSRVLVSFQVQQSDQNLRVVDQDGSVYTGYWRAGDAPDQNQKTLATTPPAPASGLSEADARAYKDRQQAAQNYFFQVTGTNQSLKQSIVFNGNFTAVTNGVPLVQMNGLLNNSFGGGGGAGGLQNKISNQPLQLLLSNSRISGTAVIDNNQQIQINAVPTTVPR